MKIAICGDVHWSKYSSIVRKRGNKYSLRLENLIESVNWFEDLSKDCDLVVYLGDFFDSSSCDAEEISALQEVKWNAVPKRFLVGNHEMGNADLSFNSTNLFNLADFKVVDKVVAERYEDNLSLIFIPYILEANRKSLSEYIGNGNNNIIFSHNDINGFEMGRYVSDVGFKIDEIERSCIKYFNGHLHNGGKVTNKIINVGNLTGQNFSEDAFVYDHSVIIFDTQTFQCAVYTNPYAFNFYKLDFRDRNDIDYINDISFKIRNAVCTIQCYEDDVEYLRARFDPSFKHDVFPKNCNVVESRFIIQLRTVNAEQKIEEVISVDHIEQFKTYMINLLGNSSVLQKELQEICR